MIESKAESPEDSVRMKDFQRNRLKHLLASAILELWKKETGSMAAVLIEATICITSGNGKTTVLQVADKFGGSIPEAGDDNNNNLRQPVYPDPFLRFTLASPTHLSNSKYNFPPKVDISLHPNNGNYMEDMSPRSLVSPRMDRCSRERRDSSPRLMKMESREHQAMDTSSTSKEEDSDSASESCDPCTPRDKGRSQSISTPSYHSTPNPQQSRSSIQMSALNLSATSEAAEEEDGSPPKRHRQDSLSESDPDNNRRAVDLSRPESDLVLSPPSSYTAQVRDVIRQRLLASKTNQELNNNNNNNLCVKEESCLERQDSGRGGSPSPVRDLPLSSPSIIYNHLPPSSMDIVNGQLMHRSLSGSLVRVPIPLVGQPPLGMLDPSLHHPLLKHKTELQALRTPSPLQGPENMSPNIHPGQMSPPGLDKSSDGSPGEKDANGEQRVYKCQYCNKTFLFKSKYHEHLPVHTNTRPFQCHLCSRTYKYKYDLRVHLRTHMGIPTKSTVCPFCNAKFDTNKLLRLHIQESHRDKQKLSEEECTNNSEHLPPAL